MEISRHAIQAALQFQTGVVLSAAVMFDRLIGGSTRIQQS